MSRHRDDVLHIVVDVFFFSPRNGVQPLLAILSCIPHAFFDEFYVWKASLRCIRSRGRSKGLLVAVCLAVRVSVALEDCATVIVSFIDLRTGDKCG